MLNGKWQMDGEFSPFHLPFFFSSHACGQEYALLVGEFK
jgi:hypothetical protein